MATLSIFLPGECHRQRSLAGLQPMGSQRVGHGRVSNTLIFTFLARTLYKCQEGLSGGHIWRHSGSTCLPLLTSILIPWVKVLFDILHYVVMMFSLVTKKKSVERTLRLWTSSEFLLRVSIHW